MNAPVLTCPCCGQPVPRGQFQAVDLVRDLRLSGQLAAILSALVEYQGLWVHTDKIVDALYGDDPDGGPLCATNVVRVQMTRLRRLLRPIGYEIHARHGGRGNHDSYRRLVRVAA